MKKIAIFDMDGLMFDTEAVYARAWIEVAHQYGYDPDSMILEEIRGTSGKTTDRVIEKYLPSIEVDAYHNDVRKYVRDILDVHVPKKEGLDEILQFFYHKKVPIAVASGSQRKNIIKNLKSAGVYSYIDYIISGHDVKRGKPYPDIYLDVCEHYKIEPNEAYVFEDGLSGIEASLNAGCCTYMIIDLAKPTDRFKKECKGIYHSLLEAKNAIQNE